VEASWPKLRVVSSYFSKLACCFADFSLVTKLIDEVDPDRQAFLVKG